MTISLTRPSLLSSLLSPPSPTPEESADQTVKEWQREAITNIRNTFALFRRSLGANADGAAMAGQVDEDRKLSQASVELLAKWHRQETKMLNEAASTELAEEARKWCLLLDKYTHESFELVQQGKTEGEAKQWVNWSMKDVPTPKLVALVCAVREVLEGIPCDANGERAYNALDTIARNVLINNARAIPSLAPPQQPNIASAPEAEQQDKPTGQAETPWYHSHDEPRPNGFSLCITGTMKELDAAISTETKVNKRSVELKLQGAEGRLWIVKTRKGRYIAYFDNPASHATAKARIEAATKEVRKSPKTPRKKPAPNRK